MRMLTREMAETLAATNRRYRGSVSYADIPNMTDAEMRLLEDVELAAELEEMTEMDENRLRRQQTSISEDLDSLGRYNPGAS